MRARNSGAMMLQGTGGVKGGQPKEPEVNTSYTAANRPENVGCLHKMLLLSKGVGDAGLVGLGPTWPATFAMGGMETAQSGECSQMPPSHSALHLPPGADIRAVF